MAEQIVDTNFDEELKKSYLAYALSVITDRALPDARDGLKPVQRRVLHSMNELGLASSGPHKKSARIVGEAMGKYHPHGDSAIYDAMARMAQPFSLRVPLVDGQGNFGSLDGDSPAAMRYTEARLAVSGELMQEDIDENAVAFVPNFDESLSEPSVMPSLLPNLLINGSQGIAVGMATNIPAHNPKEVLDLLADYLGNGCSMTVEELAEKMPGPDFPTGGEIVGRNGIRELYMTGKGKITLRGKTHIEEKKNRNLIVITEVPFGVPKERLVSQIAEELSKQSVDGVAAVRDESDRSGNRVVVELHKRCDTNAVLGLLFSNTALSTTFGGNMLALAGGSPKLLTIKDMLDIYIAHRRDVVGARTRFRLEKARARLHIVEGLLRALDILDEIIALIRSSKNTKEARAGLMEKFSFTELQSDAILEMKLARLTGLERNALEKEDKKLRANITEYEEILSKPKKMDRVILGEFSSVLATLEKQGLCERRTSLLGEEEISQGKNGMSPGQMSLVFEKPVPCIVTVEDGYIRKKDVKRKTSLETGIFLSGDLAYAVSDDGRFFSREKKYIPDSGTRKLLSIGEFFGAGKDSSLTLLSPDMHEVVFFVTEDGAVKKMSFEALRGDTSRKNTSKKIFPAGEGERIFRIVPGKRGCGIVLATSFGKALRISEDTFRDMGPGGRGVAGISIDSEDSLADAAVIEAGDADRNIVLFLDGGRCARFSSSELKTSGRGGKGVYIHRGDRPSMGKIAEILLLDDGDTIVFRDGKELPVAEIPRREISVHTLLSMFTLPSGEQWSIRYGKRTTLRENGAEYQDEGQENGEDNDCPCEQ